LRILIEEGALKNHALRKSLPGSTVSVRLNFHFPTP
jgi:hypothetical protein